MARNAANFGPVFSFPEGFILFSFSEAATPQTRLFVSPEKLKRPAQREKRKQDADRPRGPRLESIFAPKIGAWLSLRLSADRFAADRVFRSRKKPFFFRAGQALNPRPAFFAPKTARFLAPLYHTFSPNRHFSPHGQRLPSAGCRFFHGP